MKILKIEKSFEEWGLLIIWFTSPLFFYSYLSLTDFKKKEDDDHFDDQSE